MELSAKKAAAAAIGHIVSVPGAREKIEQARDRLSKAVPTHMPVDQGGFALLCPAGPAQIAQNAVPAT